MQAVILAAGRGSRLHPITTSRSKAMLPILGQPVVRRVMDTIVAAGVDEFIVVASPGDQDLLHYFQEECDLHARVKIVFQPERKGMANALLQAVPQISGDFILSACDNLLPADDVSRLVTSWQHKPGLDSLLTLMNVSPEQTAKVGVVEMEGDRVRRIVEKPAPGTAPSTIASLPLYLFHSKFLEFLPLVKPSPRGEYELQDAIQALIDHDGDVRGLLVEKRLTLTTAADLLAINRAWLSSSLCDLQTGGFRIGAGTSLVFPLMIEAGTVIGSECIIGPDVYIERGCKIGDRVHLRDAVILRGTTVPDGQRIEGTVVS